MKNLIDLFIINNIFIKNRKLIIFNTKKIFYILNNYNINIFC